MKIRLEAWQIDDGKKKLLAAKTCRLPDISKFDCDVLLARWLEAASEHEETRISDRLHD
jgi:hypothetical protein